MCVNMAHTKTVSEENIEFLKKSDGFQSTIFACKEIAKTYPHIFCLAWSGAKKNKKGEIYKVGGTLKMPIDDISNEDEYRIFFDIMDIYVSAMKKYKPVDSPGICKDFSTKNVDITLIFRSFKGKPLYYPRVSAFIKYEGRMFSSSNCPKGHPKYTGPYSTIKTKFQDFDELRKKYVKTGSERKRRIYRGMS